MYDELVKHNNSKGPSNFFKLIFKSELPINVCS